MLSVFDYLSPKSPATRRPLSSIPAPRPCQIRGQFWSISTSIRMEEDQPLASRLLAAEETRREKNQSTRSPSGRSRPRAAWFLPQLQKKKIEDQTDLLSTESIAGFSLVAQSLASRTK